MSPSEKRELDRWITREPDYPSEDEDEDEEDSSGRLIRCPTCGNIYAEDICDQCNGCESCCKCEA